MYATSSSSSSGGKEEPKEGESRCLKNDAETVFALWRFCVDDVLNLRWKIEQIEKLPKGEDKQTKLLKTSVELATANAALYNREAFFGANFFWKLFDLDDIQFYRLPSDLNSIPILVGELRKDAENLSTCEKDVQLLHHFAQNGQTLSYLRHQGAGMFSSI
jgi:hypothetical protein